MTEKKELTNLTKEELVAEIAGLGEKKFPGKTIVAMDIFSRCN